MYGNYYQINVLTVPQNKSEIKVISGIQPYWN